MSWADGPLCGLDIETTGGDPETARIVAVALVFVGDKVPPARHGITTRQARSKGLAPAKALQRTVDKLEGAWTFRRPVIGFNIVSDLTVLDREMRRHVGAGLAVTGPVIDPHVIDQALGRRQGARTLEATCQHYNVRHGRAHDPTEDALAAARLAWRLARRYPKEVGRLSLADLHRQQIDWAQEWADRLTISCRGWFRTPPDGR